MTEKKAPLTLHSQEAEEAVIGSILINPGALQAIDLAPEAFYIRRLGATWRAFRNLEARGVDVDYLTVCEELERMGKLTEVGGPAYLTGLIGMTPTSLHVDEYAQIVRDYARRRTWVELANRVAKAAWDLDQDLEQEASGIVDELLRAVQAPGAAGHISQYTRPMLEEAIERMKNPTDIWGIQTGFEAFDRITGGLQLGEMLNVSGDPGVGKSIFVDQMGFQIALLGRPGVIYSLEMPGSQVVRRRVSYLARVGTQNIKSGRFDPERLTNLKDAVQEIDLTPLYMSDSIHWTTASLRADMTRMKASHGIEWFVLDYAYLLQDGRGMNENEKTGLVSAQLKGICRGLGLAGVVILSQSKEGLRESTKSGVGLRGSGQQFYDADLLLFLSEVIGPDKKPAGRVLCTFGKGRELPNPKQGFELVRVPGYPALGNITGQVSQYGDPL